MNKEQYHSLIDEMIKDKNCPYCGNKVIRKRTGDDDLIDYYDGIYCPFDNMSWTPMAWYSTMVEPQKNTKLIKKCFECDEDEEPCEYWKDDPDEEMCCRHGSMSDTVRKYCPPCFQSYIDHTAE